MPKKRILPFLNYHPFSPAPLFLEKILTCPFCHQVTLDRNWSLVSLWKLPYLLGAIWPIIASPDHIPVFPNEWDSEAGIVPFVIMLYLFRVCNQWCMDFMFRLYFLIFICFYNQFDWYDKYDIFSSPVALQIIFNCY